MSNKDGVVYQPKGGRNFSIDVARIVFCFIIFLNHSATLINPKENVTPYMMFGFLGVEFFFILSGYLMAAKADSVKDAEIGPSTVAFLYRKISSFIPYYLIAWIMGMYVDSIGKTAKAIAINIINSLPAVLQINMAGYRGYQVLDPTGFLSVMILTMLILYPLLLRFRRSFTLAIAPVVCVFSYGFLFLKVGNLATIEPLEDGVISTGLIRGLGGISLGCMCYEASRALSGLPLNRRGGIAVGVVELLAFGLAVFSAKTRSSFRPDFIFICFAALGITAGFCRQNALLIKTKAGRAWIGRFSLCLYLVDPIARTIILRLLPDATRDQRLAPAIGLAVLLAVAVQVLGGLLRRLGNSALAWIRLLFLEQPADLANK